MKRSIDIKKEEISMWFSDDMISIKKNLRASTHTLVVSITYKILLDELDEILINRKIFPNFIFKFHK